MLEMLKKIFNRGHGRFLEMLSDYVDSELPEAERIAMEAHLQGCDSCAEELESLRATVLMLRRMPEVEAPRSFRIAPAAVTAPTPPPERPVLLWAMRVSTAMAVVAFTVMVAGNVTGLFGGGGGDGGTAASEDEMAYDSSSFSATATPAPMMEEDSAEAMLPPTPEAMMESEPDIIPKSTPMMMAERTATPEPEAMMEPTAVPEEAREEPTATPKPQSDMVASSASDDSLKYETTISVTEPALVVTAMPEPTPAPALTATPRPRPTTAPTPSPTLTPKSTPAPTSAPIPTPITWARSIEEHEDDGNGVVLGLTVGLGALAAALALGTLYLTVRRRRGVG